jgi:CheY-like chemotaxis protein
VNADPLVLVVEDNEANQLLTRSVLELDGFRVDIVASAAEAVEWLKRQRP